MWLKNMTDLQQHFLKARKKNTEFTLRGRYSKVQKIGVIYMTKAVTKAHAESKGESLKGFINRAIHETMSRDETE